GSCFAVNALAGWLTAEERRGFSQRDPEADRLCSVCRGPVLYCARSLELSMADTSRFTIICPCCEATLNIDADTGAILSHEEKQKPLASFEGLVKDLDKQKQTREQIFAQEMNSMKDRERLLEEKFREAMKRAEKDKDKVYKNPLD